MKSHILVIEDNPWNAKLVIDILRSLNYEATSAANGIEGVQQAVDRRPDIILLDIMLPDKSGIVVTRELRAIPELAETPIIALTANDSPRVYQECMEAGCSGFMTKPFTRRMLAGVLEQFIKV